MGHAPAAYLSHHADTADSRLVDDARKCHLAHGLPWHWTQGGTQAGAMGWLITSYTPLPLAGATEMAPTRLARAKGEAEALDQRLNLGLAGDPDMQVHILACRRNRIVALRGAKARG
mmetsp:Transcript_13892/g.24348  ORF Transcript_13892/g.24348 Transcript_13892/m.24348 type:complete len:117 (-) Transcript_13892:229-579(-)